MRLVNRILLIAVIAFFLGGCYDFPGMFSQTKNDEDNFSGRILVKLKNDATIKQKKLTPLAMNKSSLERFMHGHSLRSIRRHVPDDIAEKIKQRMKQAGRLPDVSIHKRVESMKNRHVLQFDNISFNDAEIIAKELCKDDRVEYAEPDYTVHASETFPVDEYLMAGYQNQLFQIQMPEAWDYTTGSSDVIVAVIDTGVAYNHPDLTNNCIPGYDFANDDSDPIDDHYHGTHVAGIIAAEGNNTEGIAGVAWHLKIMPLKFMNPLPDGRASGSTSDAIDCIEYAVAHGASILNNSWGGGSFSSALQDAIIEARDAGVLFIASAGNDGSDNDSTPSYPASYDVENIVSVAATYQSIDMLTSFSNYGLDSVDLAAPGQQIYSTTPTFITESMSKKGVYDEYDYRSGTSMAAPHVAGVAALLKSMNSGLTYSDIKNIMLVSVDIDPALEGKVATGGRVNAYAALQRWQTPPVDTLPITTIASSYNESANLVGDFNGDEKSDLLVWHYSNQTAHDSSVGTNRYNLYLSNAHGFNAPITTIARSYNESANLVGDFNGDGKSDLLVWHYSNQTTSDASVGTNRYNLYLSNGNGFNAPITTIARSYNEIANLVGDFNGDGKSDLLVWHYSNQTTSDASVGTYRYNLYLSNGNGFNAPITTIARSYNESANLVGDFDGDGKSDLLVWHYSNQTTDDSPVGTYRYNLYLSNGNGFNAPITTIARAYETASNLVGDFNGDGKSDLLVWHYSNQTTDDSPVGTHRYNLYASYGNGFNAPITTIARPYNGNSNLVGDFTGDGKSDLLVWHYSNQTTEDSSVGTHRYNLYASYGTGFNAPLITNARAYNLASNLVGDFTGDGKTDILNWHYRNETTTDDPDGTIRFNLYRSLMYSPPE